MDKIERCFHVSGFVALILAGLAVIAILVVPSLAKTIPSYLGLFIAIPFLSMAVFGMILFIRDE